MNEIDVIKKAIIQAKKLGKPCIVTKVLSEDTFKQLFELGFVVQNTFEKGRGNSTKISW